jgi:hypothetical protein
MLEIWDVAGDLPRPEPVVAPMVQAKPRTPWRTFGIAAAVCALASRWRPTAVGTSAGCRIRTSTSRPPILFVRSPCRMAVRSS